MLMSDGIAVCEKAGGFHPRPYHTSEKTKKEFPKNKDNKWSIFIATSTVSSKNSSRLRGTFLSNYKKVETGYNS